MRLRVIDTETTGLEPLQESVVEVGSTDLVSVDGDPAGTTWKVDKYVVQLMNPGKPIPPEAMGTHHIMDEDVVDAPPPATAMVRYHEATGGDPDFWVAHNAPYDRAFLSRLGSRYADPKRWIDTLKCAKHLYPDAPSFGLQVLRYWLGIGRDIIIPGDMPIEEVAPHRALYDTLVTAEVLNRMLTLRTPEELAELSLKPALLKICGLKKHKGMLWKNVPADYLKWCVKQSEMDEDVRHTCMHYLNNPEGPLI